MRAFIIAALAGALLAGCSHQQVVEGQKAVAKALIPPEQEQQLGLQIRQELSKKGVRYVTDPTVDDFVDRVARSVLVHAHEERPDVTWKVSVIDDPKTVNAFATPGGYLYVYTGLLLAVDNEAELAGVLGHEAGHVVARHPARQLLATYGLQGVAAMALGQNPSQVAQVASSLLATGALLAYSRSEETEADEHGATYASEAGYDPHALITFFQKLQRSEGQVPAFLKFLSDHPLTSDRIAHLEKYIQSHHLTGTRLAPDVGPVQRRIRAGVSSTPARATSPATPPPAPDAGA